MKRVILCVDDEKTVLSSVKSQLKSNFHEGFSFETANNAEEALEVIEDITKSGAQIILIVSDWLMPGVKGDQLLIDIHKKHPGITAILLTGHADEKAIENAKKNADLFACIHKPWSEENLVQTIRSAVKHQRDKENQ